MTKGPPKSVAIEHNEYEARFVGRTEDGRRFFLTNPFVPAIGKNAGREFLALYIFDKGGALLGAHIEDLGTRAKLDEEAARIRRTEMLESLGSIKFGKIKVAPFRIEMFGVEFGFIPQSPEEKGDNWSVIVEPGNYMCFIPPWTSGEYDT